MIRRVMRKYYGLFMSTNKQSKNTNINLKKNRTVLEKRIMKNTNEIKEVSQSLTITNKKIDALSKNINGHLEKEKIKSVLVLINPTDFVPTSMGYNEFNFYYTSNLDLFLAEKNFDFYITMDKFQQVDKRHLVTKLRENKSFIDSDLFTNESICEWNIPLNTNSIIGDNFGIIMTNQMKLLFNPQNKDEVKTNISNFYPYKAHPILESNTETSFSVIYEIANETEIEIKQNINKIFSMYSGQINIILMNNKYPLLKVYYEMYKNVIVAETNIVSNTILNDYVLFFKPKTNYQPSFFNYISERCKTQKQSYFLGTPSKPLEELSVSKNRLVVAKDILEENLSDEKWLEIVFSRTTDNIETIPFLQRVDLKFTCTPDQYYQALNKVLANNNYDKNYLYNNAYFYYKLLKNNFYTASRYNLVRFFSLNEGLYTVLRQVLDPNVLSHAEKQVLNTEFSKLPQLEKAFLENMITYKDGVCYYVDCDNNRINNSSFLIDEIVKVKKVRNEYYFTLKLTNKIELLSPVVNYEVYSSNTINLACELNDVVSIAIKEGDCYEQKSFSIRDFV